MKTTSRQTCPTTTDKIYALVQTSPAITDPRELQTILTTSLRSLFGQCESHSVLLDVLVCRRRPRRNNHDNISSSSISNGVLDDVSVKETDDNWSYEAILECPKTSWKYVRAALTFSDVPSYFDGKMYRFDFLRSANSVRGLD